MSYLVLLPCLLAVYSYVRSHGFPGYYFTTVAFLLTVIIASTGLMLPGADALLATSLAMCVFNMARWHTDKRYPADNTSESVAVALKPFCTDNSHDFAIRPADTDFAVDLLVAEKWDELSEILAGLDSTERQGFYANFDYSRLSKQRNKTAAIEGNSLLKFTNVQPDCADAHVLYGHSKLCEAKVLGLTAGAIPEEDSATALAVAFRHFHLALRIDPDHTEALCGLILAKGFTGLSDEHIEKSLQRLLSIDEAHFHGLLAAAGFLVKSNVCANRFVNIVERVVGENNATAAFARIVAHVECMMGPGLTPSQQSRAVSDLHAQLRVYHSESAELGSWQQAICNNIVAFAFEKAGDKKQRAFYLARADGLLSPYPWQRVTEHTVVEEGATADTGATPSR